MGLLFPKYFQLRFWNRCNKYLRSETSFKPKRFNARIVPCQAWTWSRIDWGGQYSFKFGFNLHASKVRKEKIVDGWTARDGSLLYCCRFVFNLQSLHLDLHPYSGVYLRIQHWNRKCCLGLLLWSNHGQGIWLCCWSYVRNKFDIYFDNGVHDGE